MIYFYIDYLSIYTRSMSISHQSEILLGRNDIYKEICTKKILHTASMKLKVANNEYIISVYTGLPKL